eukprot:m.469210 g.469210  ORF g.469210 m.469210 type:complete len:382 (-) comp28277_c0_seq1:134-1279(-)
MPVKRILDVSTLVLLVQIGIEVHGQQRTLLFGNDGSVVESTAHLQAVCARVPPNTAMLEVVMGLTRDFRRPPPGRSWCDMLTTYVHQQFLHGGQWVITPCPHARHFGGSAHNWPLNNVAGDRRASLSFWSHTQLPGGCCFPGYDSSITVGSGWGQPFTVYAIASSSAPTDQPTAHPSMTPTASPTVAPAASPTERPTTSPTASPTASPTTKVPTRSPSASPTALPSPLPTLSPTPQPTTAPTVVTSSRDVVNEGSDDSSTWIAVAVVTVAALLGTGIFIRVRRRGQQQRVPLQSTPSTMYMNPLHPSVPTESPDYENPIVHKLEINPCVDLDTELYVADTRTPPATTYDEVRPANQAEGGTDATYSLFRSEGLPQVRDTTG